jgi:hypothetical protein
LTEKIAPRTVVSRKKLKSYSQDTNVLGLLLSMFGLWASDQQLSDFVGFAYQGKSFVFRFIMEYSSLKDFGP